jgi:hypothetical protein
MAEAKPSSRRSAPSRSKSRSAARVSKPPSGGSTRGRATTRGGASVRKASVRSRQATRAPSARATNGRSTVESVTETVSSGAQTTARGVAGFAKKAKVPLIAGGAAIAGLAGGVALNARSRRRTVLGVTMPSGNQLKKVHTERITGAVTGAAKRVKMPSGNQLKNVDAEKITGTVSDAAKRADRWGQRVSSVAKSVQTMSESAKEAAKKT